MKAWVVLTAAGSGSRLGSDVPKALVEVGGKTLLQLALERVLASGQVEGITVSCPRGFEAEFSTILCATISDRSDVTWNLTPGGGTRQESVFLALQSIPGAFGNQVPESLPLLVHDAARCLTPTALFDSVIDAVNAGARAVIPVLPVVDTVKVVDPQTGLVLSTPDRATLKTVQTPQGFAWKPLFDSHVALASLGASEGAAATDDAGLVENQGVPVQTVLGDALAFKVTIPEDLERLVREL